MKNRLFAFIFIFLLLGSVGIANAVIVDFSGGIATMTDGTTATTNNSDTYYGVDYYIENGIKIDFVGGSGIVGNYYGEPEFGHQEIQNAVLHAHWDELQSIIVTKLDGSPFDLNYMDLTSNTDLGGLASSGNELSYVSANGNSMLLPSSDWGIDYLFTGGPGDGIERLWLDNNFDNITSFIVTSQNAYCFGLDNFYIDEPAPVGQAPIPGSIILLGTGLIGLSRLRARKKR